METEKGKNYLQVSSISILIQKTTELVITIGSDIRLRLDIYYEQKEIIVLVESWRELLILDSKFVCSVYGVTTGYSGHTILIRNLIKTMNVYLGYISPV